MLARFFCDIPKIMKSINERDFFFSQNIYFFEINMAFYFYLPSIDLLSFKEKCVIKTDSLVYRYFLTKKEIILVGKKKKKN